MSNSQYKRLFSQGFALVTICLASLACGINTISTPNVLTATPQFQRSPTVMDGDQQQSTQTNSEASKCESNNWSIYPINYYRYPQGDGWDFVLVDLAVTNNSKYWGTASMGPNNFTITTENGFAYAPFQGWFENVPQNPMSPYSGTTYYQYGFISSNLLPPGFTMIGLMESGVSSGAISRFTFGFKVASQQLHLVLNINNTSVLCVNPDINNASETIPDTSIALENLSLPTLPTNRPATDFQNITDLSIQIPEFGTINYKNTAEGTDGMEFSFTFTNANQGYEETGSILQSYIIGDDGISRISDCSIALTSCYDQGGYDAGPGQTVDILPIPIRRPDASVHNIKFVLIDSKTNLYQVFNVERSDKVVNHLVEADQAEGVLTINSSFGDVTIEKINGLYTAEDVPSCIDLAADCEQYFKNNRGLWAYKITIPTAYGLSMSESNYGGSNWPDRFFSYRNDGVVTSPGCFFESWDGFYEPAIYQSTNPAMMYCEAKDNATLEFHFYMNSSDWNSTPYEFNLKLDPYTGMLALDR
jgi:hypothetical protein